jgi:hypothetical protein
MSCKIEATSPVDVGVYAYLPLDGLAITELETVQEFGCHNLGDGNSTSLLTTYPGGTYNIGVSQVACCQS